jgi:hypothetical protein
MKEQTAVEWLVNILPLNQQEGLRDTIDKAKAMDKEQKSYFFNCGRQYQLTGEGTFTEVYIETFKPNEM